MCVCQHGSRSGVVRVQSVERESCHGRPDQLERRVQYREVRTLMAYHRNGLEITGSSHHERVLHDQPKQALVDAAYYAICVCPNVLVEAQLIAWTNHHQLDASPAILWPCTASPTAE